MLSYVEDYSSLCYVMQGPTVHYKYNAHYVIYFHNYRELEMAEIHNQKLHEPCVEEYQIPKVLDKSQQTNIGDTDLVSQKSFSLHSLTVTNKKM